MHRTLKSAHCYHTPSGQSIENNEIQIYPNPSTGFVNIRLRSKINDVTIRVNGINGEANFFHEWKYQGNIILDLSSHPKGIYLLTITTQDKVFTEKVILQ